MKKTILTLLIVLLAVPIVVLAQQDKAQPATPPAERPGLEQLQGRIVAVTEDELTIDTGTKDKPQQTKVAIPKMHTAEFSDLLNKGIGKQAKLRCWKTPQGVLNLARIDSIEGVDVSTQPTFGPWPGQRMQRQHGQLNGAEQDGMRDRFRAMYDRLKENPELRRELRSLAKEDFPAFRQRIRRIHELTRDSIKGTGRGPGQLMPGGSQGPGPFGTGPMSAHQMISPEIMKLEQQSLRLAGQYRRAEPDKKEELAAKVRTSLSEIFDKKDQERTKQVERLEKQLKKFKENLEKRRENREAIIEKRFEKLTGQGENLAW